jgi:superoxide dismutase, Cu-Zn family
MKDHLFKPILFCAALGASAGAQAAYTVRMHLVDADGVGKSIGQVTISETEYGTLFTPELKDLPPGSLGFHVHQKPNCEPAEKNGAKEPAQAAGEHYDPEKTKKHGGPWKDESHRGDLPTLNVADNGKATQPILAPRLKLDEVKNKSLVIHAGGDTYSDRPEPAGGSGKRIACGIVKAD